MSRNRAKGTISKPNQRFGNKFSLENLSILIEMKIEHDSFFANESCKSRCNRLVETQKAFLLSILHYLRSRALPYHYSDKTCETFAKANVSGVKLQKLFVRITVDFTLYGDVRAIKDFCQVAVGN